MRSEQGGEPKLAFIIGAARSGTTWLAKSLSADHRVAATYETHMFNAYIAPFIQTWRNHMEAAEVEAERWYQDGTPPNSVVGLPFVVDEEEFMDFLSGFVDNVFDSIAKAAPHAQVIVEKTPSHSLHVTAIDRLTGGKARYIHIIRNGYDVVASTNAASAGWAADWAPRDPVTAARKWAAAVEGARVAEAFGDRYLEIRYEDLKASPEEGLLKIMRHAGLDATSEDARQAAEGSEEGLFVGGAGAELFGGNFGYPIGFRRHDQTEQSVRTRAAIEAAVGPLLSELGYLKPDDVPPLLRTVLNGAGAASANFHKADRLIRRVRSDIQKKR